MCGLTNAIHKAPRPSSTAPEAVGFFNYSRHWERSLSTIMKKERNNNYNNNKKKKKKKKEKELILRITWIWLSGRLNGIPFFFFFFNLLFFFLKKKSLLKSCSRV